MQWSKVYHLDSKGNDTTTYIRQTSDGGYVLVANTHFDSSGYGYAWLVRLDSSGKIKWKQSFKDPKGSVVANWVRQTSDGGFVFAGSRAGKMNLVKTDEKGNKNWEKTWDYVNSVAYCVRTTQDDGFVLAGVGYGVSDGVAMAIRTDKSGKTMWKYEIKGIVDSVSSDPAFAQWFSIQETSDGKGYIFSGGEGGGGFLIKLDKKGKLLWRKPFGEYSEYRVDENDYSYCYYDVRDAIQAADGGYALILFEIIQTHQSDEHGDTWDEDGRTYVIKTDANGNEVWCMDSRNNYAKRIYQNGSDAYITVEDDRWTVNATQYNIVGISQWNLNLRETLGEARGTNIQPTRDGGYIISAYNWSGPKQSNSLCIVKLSAPR